MGYTNGCMYVADFKKFVDHINRTVGIRDCPACGKSDFVLSHITVPTTTDNIPIRIYRSYFVRECENCAHTQFFRGSKVVPIGVDCNE